MESERRTSRRKRKLSARQGVVIGVATVAGLGLMTKLLSFLRREPQPKEVKDDDIETLEAVLSGDAAKGALSPQTAEVHVFANLDNDEPEHALLNGHHSSPPSSKDAHSDVSKKDDVTTEMYMSQDLVRDPNSLATEKNLPSFLSQEEVNMEKMPHSNGEEGEVNDSSEDAVTDQIHIGDALEVLVEDAEKLNTEDEGNVVKDVVAVQGEHKAQPPSEDAVEQLIEHAEKAEAKDEEKYQEGAGELQITEGEGKLHSEEADELES